MKLRKAGAGLVVCASILFTGCTKPNEEELNKTGETEVIQEVEQEPEIIHKEKTQEILDFEERVRQYNPDTNLNYNDKQFVMMNLDQEPYSNPKINEDLDDILILVNKYNGLPTDYVPSDLINVNSSGENGVVQMRKEAGEAFNKLSEWSSRELHISLTACSAFRDANYQSNLWENGKTQGGIEYADQWWTRAGYSEHQTGLAVDVRLNNDFSDLDAVRKYSEYEDILSRLADFGFILRYPEEKEDITHISPESWHFRYVGKDVARKIAKEKITFEQYIADRQLEELYKDFPEELARG